MRWLLNAKVAKTIKTWTKIFMKRLKFADFELEAFSKKNLEINAWFVAESCTKMNIPYRMSHSLTARKYCVVKGPFVHAKAKQIFESVVYRTKISLFHNEYSKLVDYCIKHLGPGINANLREFAHSEKLPPAKNLVQEQVERYLAEFKSPNIKS